jgi:Rps23 Pro-64 3,4-dihydroxylase Tpa1-like proline 4-hydroxylase
MEPQVVTVLSGRVYWATDVLPLEDREQLLDRVVASEGRLIPSLHPNTSTLVDRDLVAPILAKAQDFLLRELGIQTTVDASVLAYSHNGMFRPHLDASDWSFIYYFRKTKDSFYGGELRIYDIGDPTSVDFVLIPPLDNSLVLFPSTLLHEVLPVHMVDTTEFADSRFCVSGFAYRASRSGATSSGDWGRRDT